MSILPNPSSDERERDLFLSALDKSAPEERAAFLDRVCADDQDLRNRVEDLLRQHEEVGAFLERPAVGDPRQVGTSVGTEVGPGGTQIFGLATEGPGDRIGRYKLLQQIGEGGCGVVYMAEQEEPVRRRVALKVIKMGMDTKSVIARFEAERQALAMMEHPNIAKVLDAGATEAGRPYFVMELVRGIKITDYCDQNNLPPGERLKLFVEVCQAIQHAHQKGIIHRDIKPSNILVTLHDGIPVPKVIDFGIAKATEQRLTERTLFTEFTAFIGTPAYMSPEQAEMSGLDIDTRSDIYSLGVLLYELLTGRTPFDPETLMRAGLDECRRTIREQEPVRPSNRLETLLAVELTTTAQQRRTDAPRLIHLLRGDLDWVVMKCLEKDRARRYDTAHDVAADVQRYLENEPVLARPPSNVYRLQKLLHRHRAAVLTALGVAATLFIGAGISAWQAVRATRAEHQAQVAQRNEVRLRRQADTQRERAEQKEQLSRLNEYVADVTLAQGKLAEGNYGRALHLLDKHEPKPNEKDLRGFEWRYLWKLAQGEEPMSFPVQDGPVQAVGLSPDGRWLAIGLRDRLRIWDWRTQTLFTNLSKGVVSLAFSPDSQKLYMGGPAKVRVYRTRDWTEDTDLPGTSGAVSLSPDGSLLATETERRFGGPDRGGVRVWDTTTWDEVRSLPGMSSPMAFSPDGRTLATDSPAAGITLWKLDSVQAPVVLATSTNLFGRSGPWFRNNRMVAFTPDGRSVVAARNSISDRGVFVLGIWNAQTGVEIGTMPEDPEHVEHTGIIAALAFSPDGTMLATASWDHSVRLWDMTKRQRIRAIHGHLNEVWALDFSADGQTIVSGAKDGGVKLWATFPKAKQEGIPGAWEPLGFSADGHRLAAWGRQNQVAFFNVHTREIEQAPIQLREQSDRPGFRGWSRVTISADLRTLGEGLDDGTVRIWNTETGDSTLLKTGGRRLEVLALSPDASVLITGERGRPLRWWDRQNDTNGVLAAEASRVWFSPDSRTLLTSHPRNGVELWDVPTWTVRTKLPIESPIIIVGFSPDSRLLATALGPEDVENAIRFWDTRTGRPKGACTGHMQGVWSIAFSPDGKTVATASDDSTLRLWNVDTQLELLSIRRLGVGLRGLLFSPDGRLLVASSGLQTQQGGLRFFEAPLVNEIQRSRVQEKAPSPVVPAHERPSH